MVLALDRISIELTNRCSKGCWFCYNASAPTGETAWSVDEVTGFVRDCSAHGIRAVSFGGGEPLQFPGLFDVLANLRGVLFRSLTTNGLLLDAATVARLAQVGVDKVHVSIHFPENPEEVGRVIDAVAQLSGAGIRSGVNLLVARSKLEAAAAASRALHGSGVGPERIVYLPMRGQDTPTPAEVAQVAGSPRFQSMSCLAACARSERFCSIGWDRRVAWCSYTRSRRFLGAPTWAGLCEALDGLGLEFCGGTDHAA